MNQDLKLKAAWNECQLHAESMQYSLALINKQGIQFDPKHPGLLSMETRLPLDMLAYRFIKLQDTLGEKILPGLLEITQEPISPSALFGEKLQKLERLEILPSADQWRSLRDVRNSVAHEYPDHPEVAELAISQFIFRAKELLSLFTHISHHPACASLQS